jgi:hypothetical protein
MRSGADAGRLTVPPSEPVPASSPQPSSTAVAFPVAFPAALPVVLALGWARLRFRPLRRLLIVLGVAAATALPVAAQGSAQVVAAQAVQYGVGQLPAGQRSLIVSTAGIELAGSDLAALDRRSRVALARLTDAPVRLEMLYRQIGDQHGGTFFLGAVDALAQTVRVTQGRLPASCTAQRCEVVVVGPGTPALDPALGLVVVGRAVRTDPLLLTGTFDPGHDAPLLLADGVSAAQRLASLQLFQRSYGWVVPLDLAQVRRLGVAAYLARSAATTDLLRENAEPLTLTAPDQVLQAQDARASLSSRRFTLLGAAATVLLLGFCVIAATGLRRDRIALDGLLTRRGASRRTVRALAAVEAVAPVMAGTVLGLGMGAALAAAAASGGGLGSAATAGSAVRAALPAAAVGAVLATVVVAVTSSWVGSGPRTAWRVVDALVLGAAAAGALAVARGTVGAAALDGGTDPLLAALPVLVVVCGGLLAARLWPPAVTALGRALPGRWVGTRLALLGGVRRPLRSVATVAFVTAATAVVVFAGSYRATLAQGAVDQAAFAVPLSARLTPGTTLERPLDLASPGRLAAAAPGTAVYPVVRSSASVRVSATEGVPVEVIGVDPAALPRVASWGNVVGALDPATAGGLLTVPSAGATPGVPVPAGATRLVLPASGNLAQVQLTAWLRLPDGRDAGVSMVLAGGGFVGALPPPVGVAGGARFFAFTLAESIDYATRHQHAIGEGLNSLNVLAGQITFGAPSFGAVGSGGTAAGALTAAGWAGWGATSTTGSVSATVVAGALRVDYAFTGDRIVVRADAQAAEADLPVLVDPGTAARAVGGRLPLALTTGLPVTGRVVGVLPRFPTVGGSFVVADEAVLADRLDSREPGTGAVEEVWLWAPAGAGSALDSSLAQPPYDRLSVALRSVEQDRLATDPLALGAAGLLVTSALLALAVAVLAVVLLVVADRRDEAAELYAWEADGLAPRTLRRSLFARAAAVVLLAVPAGLLVGLVLTRATASIVAVTAVGTTPTPPLALSVGPAWVAAALGLGLVVSLAAAAAVAASSLREVLPAPPDPGPW